MTWKVKSWAVFVTLHAFITFASQALSSFQLKALGFLWPQYWAALRPIVSIVSQDMPPLLAEPVGLTMAASASASAETRQAKTRQDAKTKLEVREFIFSSVRNLKRLPMSSALTPLL